MSLLVMYNVHQGSLTNFCTNLNRYMFCKNNNNNVGTLNILKLWHKIVLAARILAAYPSELILIMTQRPQLYHCVKLFAKLLRCKHLSKKFHPGTFTNPRNKHFIEPRLLVVDDNKGCHQAKFSNLKKKTKNIQKKKKKKIIQKKQN